MYSLNNVVSGSQQFLHDAAASGGQQLHQAEPQTYLTNYVINSSIRQMEINNLIQQHKQLGGSKAGQELASPNLMAGKELLASAVVPNYLKN